MIIFGTRGVTYTAEKGLFACPGCQERDTSYRHRRVRRFFTLYFIPVIPLDLLGEYVECDGCRSTWDPAVLDHDPDAGGAEFMAEYQRVMRRIMVQMMMADGEMDDEEVQAIKEIFGRIAEREVTDAEILAEVAALEDGVSIEDYCEKVSGNLNNNGKELVIKAALMVAAADGEFADEERELLARVASAMELSQAHFKGILAELSE